MADVWDLGEFTGEEDAGSGFSPIDSGKYRATVYEVSREVGRDSGKPYLKWCFQICEGEEFAGRRLWENTPLSDNAKWKLVQLLRGIGIDVPKGKLKLNPNELMGRETVIQVGLELDSYANDRDGTENQMRNVIKSFTPAGGTPKPKINLDGSKPAKPATKPTAEKPSLTPATPVDDDDDWDDDDDQPSKEDRLKELKALDAKSLKTLAISDYDIKIKGLKKAEVIQAVLDYEYPSEEEETAEEEEPETVADAVPETLPTVEEDDDDDFDFE